MSPPFVLLCLLLAALWLGGGASRADALGQVIARGAAVILLLAAALWCRPPRIAGLTPVWLLVAAAIALPLLQLVPLPPGLWQSLPGRDLVAEAARAAGEPQPWRPWSMVPGATANAAISLVVPFAALALFAGLDAEERQRLVAVLLVAITASMIVGLLQFSGVGFNNPFVNETVGQVSGTFANRNHLALFLAIGCLLAPAWAFPDRHQPAWRGLVALGLTLLFFLTILATGSRAGLGLGVAALVIGILLIRTPLRRALRRYPRWVFPALLATLFALFALFVLATVMAERAVSIDRMFADQGQDMRARGLPTVLAMIRVYLPWGAGMGSFDPLFRIHEPFDLLKVTYFNHAHNDLLEIGLEAGVPGALLLGSGLVWWGWTSVRAWRNGNTPALLGSTTLLLVLVASAFDYPARTPMVMAVVVIAAGWLSGSSDPRLASALPRSGQQL